MTMLFSRTIVEPIVIGLATLGLCYLSRRIVHKIFSVKGKVANEKKKKTIANLISNIIMIFIAVVGLTLVLQSFGIDTASFVASLGVFSLVIGLALQDILKDMFSGIMIILEGQYSIGDWVEIDGFKGEVIASGLRTTKLRAYTGEIKIISNGKISSMINYSLSSSTIIIDIGVSYESDIDKVKQTLNELSIKLKTSQKVSDMECLGLQELDGSSLVFRIIAHSNYADKFPMQRLIHEEIVKSFNQNNIEIPYQQVVVHNGKKL